MSRFQSTVSTFAALSTIAVTAVTAYKVFDNQQENSLKQQIIIQDLKNQLEAKKQSATPPLQVVSQPTTPLPPVVSTPPPPELPPIRQ